MREMKFRNLAWSRYIVRGIGNYPQKPIMMKKIYSRRKCRRPKTRWNDVVTRDGLDVYIINQKITDTDTDS